MKICYYKVELPIVGDIAVESLSEAKIIAGNDGTIYEYINGEWECIEN